MCTSADRFCAHCGAGLERSEDTRADPLLGRTVGDAYSLQELVGVGGMGRVYRAEQKTLGRTVAVKVIHPHLLGDEQTTARFYTEARASSRLNHPNSVSIIDFGRTDDGILFLAMEYLQGKDLALIMHEEGPLSFERIIEVMIGVLGALSEAHALGVVHRDLKPENILLRRLRSGADLVKVVDFGLATILTGKEASSITTPGLVCGTPDYMSPEQGRGENLDGRSDLYALGVVLFELLTEDLPFADETPTKVVLRHINDPVPNPAEVAPHRQIPDVLAKLTIRALSKDPEKRFRDAAAMQEALRAALEELRKVNTATKICSNCGTENPEQMNFCGSCGTRLLETGTHLRPAAPRPSFVPSYLPVRPLVGRAVEIAMIEKLRTRVAAGPSWLHISGEAGAGKTRLLNEIAQLAENDQDVVVGARPHPSRAPVPLHPVRELVASLLGVKPAALARADEDHTILQTPLIRAGLQEICQPKGLAGLNGESRVEAATRCAAAALQIALPRARSGRIVVLIDDLDLCDGLSRRVLRGLRDAAEGAVFIVTGGRIPTRGPQPTEQIMVHGIDREATQAFLAVAFSHPSSGDRDHLLLPLYLEQLEALRRHMLDDLPPLRLADAVAQRLEHLPVDGRRLLQALAVLGDRCELEQLKALTDDASLPGFERLKKEKLLSDWDGMVEIAHPFIRDLVVASIPAEARRRLHEQAFELSVKHEAPLEVRAGYAYHGGDSFGALVLLERMGDEALSRGDAPAAVLGFRRAVDLARKEMLESGEQSVESGLLTFSWKLGQSLERAGDLAGSEGVLREALDLTGRYSMERARLLIALSRVAIARDRRRDAFRHLGTALELVTREGNGPLEAEVQRSLARARREDGQFAAAANALRRACELDEAEPTSDAQRARTLLDLGVTLGMAGELDEADRYLERGLALAKKAESVALLGRIEGGRAQLHDKAGRREEARSGFVRAAEKAAEAGDVVHARLFRESAQALAVSS